MKKFLTILSTLAFTGLITGSASASVSGSSMNSSSVNLNLGWLHTSIIGSSNSTSSKTSQTLSKNFGATDTELVGSSVLNLTVTPKGNGTASIEGVINIGKDTFPIQVPLASLNSSNTSLGVVYTAVGNGTIKEFGKTVLTTVGTTYVPSTVDEQASIQIGGGGAPTFLTFGKGFITKSIYDQMHPVTNSTTTLTSQSTPLARSSSLVQPTPLPRFSSSTPTWHYINNGYTEIIDQDGDSINGPAAITLGEDWPYGSSDHYIQDQVIGTSQAENYLSNSGENDVNVYNVYFAVSSPNQTQTDGWPLYVNNENPEVNNQNLIPYFSWLFDYIPWFGPALAGIANNLGIYAGGISYNGTPNQNFIQMEWNNVSQNYTASSADISSNQPSYSEGFLGNPVLGDPVTLDGQVTYEMFSNAVGITTWDTTGWVYVNGTIQNPS